MAHREGSLEEGGVQHRPQYCAVDLAGAAESRAPGRVGARLVEMAVLIRERPSTETTSG